MKKLNFIKSKSFLLINLLIFGLVVVALAWALNLKRSPQSINLSSPQSFEVLEPGITFLYSGQQKGYPPKLKVYTLSNVKNQSDVLDKIIAVFDLQLNLDYQQYGLTKYTNQSGLSAELQDDIINLSFSSSAANQESKVPSFSNLNQKIDSFLSNLNFETENYKLDEKSISYLKHETSDSEYVTVNNPEIANLIKVNYDQMLDGYPLYVNQNLLSGLQVSATAEDLQSLSLVAHQFEVINGQENSVISPDEALTNIRQGNYIVSNRLNRVQKTLDKTINEINFTDYKIVYRAIVPDRLALPYYNFEGYAKYANGEIETIIVSTPAITTTVTTTTP